MSFCSVRRASDAPVCKRTLYRIWPGCVTLRATLSGRQPHAAHAECPSGCASVSAGDGWSARVMWRDGGALMSYNYNVGKAEACGDNEYYHRAAQAGQWMDIVQYVKVNTPGARELCNLAQIDASCCSQRAGVYGFREAQWPADCPRVTQLCKIVCQGWALASNERAEGR
jgi:hypothetical protein